MRTWWNSAPNTNKLPFFSIQRSMIENYGLTDSFSPSHSGARLNLTNGLPSVYSRVDITCLTQLNKTQLNMVLNTNMTR